MLCSLILACWFPYHFYVIVSLGNFNVYCGRESLHVKLQRIRSQWKADRWKRKIVDSVRFLVGCVYIICRYFSYIGFFKLCYQNSLTCLYYIFGYVHHFKFTILWERTKPLIIRNKLTQGVRKHTTFQIAKEIMNRDK